MLIMHDWLKLLREVTICTHLPRPFPERTTIATDDSRLREQSSSAHCKHKHRKIEALEDEFANLNNAAMLENGYSILVRLDEPVSSRVLLSSTFSLSLSLSLLVTLIMRTTLVWVRQVKKIIISRPAIHVPTWPWMETTRRCYYTRFASFYVITFVHFFSYLFFTIAPSVLYIIDHGSSFSQARFK